MTARLLEFFADTTPWPRRLWEVGSVLALREAWECGDWQHDKVLSQGAVSWFRHSLLSRLGPDRGLGGGKLRRELTGLLKSDLAAASNTRRRLAELLPRVTEGYLRRWKEAVFSDSPPDPEVLARAVAGHLLDTGHSSGALHRWVRRLDAREGATTAELLEEACTLSEQDDRDFEVLVPFRSVPQHQKLAGQLDEWLPPRYAAQWLTDNGVKSPPRHNGAFRYTIRAKDPVAAARAAGDKVRRLQGRRSYARGAKRSLEPVGRVWVRGFAEPLPLSPPARGVSIPSLERERTMYAVDGSGKLDDALELAAPLDDGRPTTAVSGAWAALESLLFQPGDTGDEEGRVVAADRLARIVACSWPRAELTALAVRHRGDAGAVTARLAECGSNLERSRVVAEELRRGGRLNLHSPADQAAEQRMRELLEDPFKRLSGVWELLSGVFRRLYRQRNIVLHGGDTTAIALSATLRSSPPLVGAGLDRIVHAWLGNGTGPLELAARAENALTLVGDPDGPDVTELLEPPVHGNGPARRT
ncbi:integrase [Actinopolyspora mortivallis]|uniref:Integrase n=1 Tax=Actinopolyspora mortivallis TaxID=33906 RepID=A0A2T0GW65_ACTMO|nr:integrase [Actinopolyspora mortivallis]